MGEHMKGRKPKPTKLRVVRGNPARWPEPKPEAKLPPPPTHLSEMAKKEWRRTGKRLLAQGLMTEIDGAALMAYCTAYARHVEAEEQILKFGTVIKAPSGFLVQSPYLAISNKAMDQMTRMLVEFGMSPSSRTRVTATATTSESPLRRKTEPRAM